MLITLNWHSSSTYVSLNNYCWRIVYLIEREVFDNSVMGIYLKELWTWARHDISSNSWLVSTKSAAALAAGSAARPLCVMGSTQGWGRAPCGGAAKHCRWLRTSSHVLRHPIRSRTPPSLAGFSTRVSIASGMASTLLRCGRGQGPDEGHGGERYEHRGVRVRSGEACGRSGHEERETPRRPCLGRRVWKVKWPLLDGPIKDRTVKNTRRCGQITCKRVWCNFHLVKDLPPSSLCCAWRSPIRRLPIAKRGGLFFFWKINPNKTIYTAMHRVVVRVDVIGKIA